VACQVPNRTWLPDVTKRATCTQAQVRRIIRAAREEGLRIAGIKPDGTILLHVGDDAQRTTTVFELDERTSTDSKWDEVEA
jgi:hypothetical protein